MLYIIYTHSIKRNGECGLCFVVQYNSVIKIWMHTSLFPMKIFPFFFSRLER